MCIYSNPLFSINRSFHSRKILTRPWGDTALSWIDGTQTTPYFLPQDCQTDNWSKYILIWLERYIEQIALLLWLDLMLPKLKLLKSSMYFLNRWFSIVIWEPPKSFLGSTRQLVIDLILFIASEKTINHRWGQCNLQVQPRVSTTGHQSWSEGLRIMM